MALIVLGATLIILAILFLVFYRKGARPAVMQQYFNMKKRLQVRGRKCSASGGVALCMWWWQATHTSAATAADMTKQLGACTRG